MDSSPETELITSSPQPDDSADFDSSEDLELVESFYFCVYENDLESLENLLMKECFDVNLVFETTHRFVKKGYYGWRALHIAASHNKIKIAELLLNLGADVNCTTPEGDTALHIAAKYGAVDIIALLLEYNIFLRDLPNNKGVTALLKTIFSYQHPFKENYRHCVSTLLGAGCNPNIPSSSLVTPLHVAVEQGDSTLVKALIASHADVNAVCSKGSYPLFRALFSKYVNSDILISLLEGGADTSVKFNGRSMLHIAVTRCDDRILEVFLKHGSDPNAIDTNSKSPLWLAVEDNNLKVVSILVANGADVNYVRHPQRLSILSLAINLNSYQMVKMLLEFGASTFTETIMWATPLHLAVENRSISIIKEIMKYNCELDTTSNAKYALRPLTPIQQAIDAGSYEVVLLLIACGCKIKLTWLNTSNILAISSNFRKTLDQLSHHILKIPSLLHLCRLSLRKQMGPNFRPAMKYLKENAVLPKKLIDCLYLTDVLDSFPTTAEV